MRSILDILFQKYNTDGHISLNMITTKYILLFNESYI